MLAVLDDDRDRIFGEWLAAHSEALFKVEHAHASTHVDREDLFQEIARARRITQTPRVEWLYRQLVELAEVERAIAVLMLDGFSYREIADVVGISENYVGVKINRIKSW